MKHITSTHGIDHLVESYHEHLREVRGLATLTCAQRARQVRDFLTAQWKGAGGELELWQLGGEEILGYLTRRRVHCEAVTLQYLASTLRSFLRFLILTRQCPAGVVQAVPKIQAGPRVGLADYLTEAQLHRLLNSLDAQTPEGACAQALILCLAKLGLRAGEAAHLALEDLDWRQATLRLTQTKGRQDRLLPLSPTVGKALAHYLRFARPATPHRQVFVSRPGGIPLSGVRVSQLVAKALGQANLVFPHPGVQLLRRTFATHLAQKGSTPKEIADLLGHRGLNTIGFYARVNLPMLQAVVQPWPEVLP